MSAVCLAKGSSPHTRGARRFRVQRGPFSNGSSPHTRGALRPCPVVASNPRIIPAYAGSTVKPRRWIIPAYAGSTAIDQRLSTPWEDHPRIRGEHSISAVHLRASIGSSPHTRGALSAERSRHLRGRIIPAYAGSTQRNGISSYSRRDHPRIRGEHVVPLPGATLAAGSSPHTRGARHGFVRRLLPPRIIPAYAGST